MELESDLAKELFNKVIIPIQTKNNNAQTKYDVNNKKLEEELISQREQEESKKKAAIEGIKAIDVAKAQREAAEKSNRRADEERIAQEAATKAEGKRLAQEAAEKAVIKAEEERLAQEAATKAEGKRLAQEAATKAEGKRLEQEAAEKAQPEAIITAEEERLVQEDAYRMVQKATTKVETDIKAEEERLAQEEAYHMVKEDTEQIATYKRDRPPPPPVSNSQGPPPTPPPTPPPPSIQNKFDVNPLIQTLTATLNKDLTQSVNESRFDTRPLLNVLSNTLADTKEHRIVSSSMPPSPDIPLNNIITSCDGEPCDDPENLQPQSPGEIVPVSQSIEGNVPLTAEPGSSSRISFPSMPSMPSVDISGKMNWITQSLVALFATVGNLFTFKPAEDTDPYEMSTNKANEGYIYIGKMYMKEEGENVPSKQVKYINYHPENKDFYIDERPEIVE